jgi:hypothetical protein
MGEAFAQLANKKIGKKCLTVNTQDLATAQ